METEMWGRYEVNLLQEGYGGTGSVYFGFDPLTKRKIAVKKMKDIAAGLKEAWVMKLYGKNKWLVEFYDFFIHENHACIVMEQLNGSILTSLGTKKAIQVTINILKGLKHLHSKGILHTDISPRNIILDNESTLDLKIIDFESAKLKDSAGVYRGKVDGWIFSPPPSKEIDNSYDLYGAAAVCTYLVTGQVNPKYVKEEKLRKILLRGMDDHPGKRYRDAAEMIKDLTSLL
ncbi:serine/threonine protein kinase [Bacillus sp. FJAT-27245]|uniref:serine/threonine protein kinase n=1 Tax=Bacillus sp. FJAT-27245 TaxID=1684144 RepID=UPI0006A7679F|nr:protein kinase [Bacillus sp. FJAT-27245]